MDALDVARWMIAECVLTGNVVLAREYATEYATARDDRMTSDEIVASAEAWVEHMKMPRSDRRCRVKQDRGVEPTSKGQEP